jgi:CRISPR-associated protein Cas1
VSDPFNVALNYGFGFLEGECQMAINVVGLEPAIGFLHEFSDYQTKQFLVYDLQEPFRWLTDLTVIQAFESKALQLHDFYFTGDDYRFRLDAEAKERFINLIREQFNSGVACKSKVLKWDTVIEQKANELGQFLTARSLSLDFGEPKANLERTDDKELRAKILRMTSVEAKALGIGKSTLHYLRRNATSKTRLRVYQKVGRKLVLES